MSVAKNFDAPIKLLFPRDLTPGVEKPFSMLGLGDIVIPGVFVALLLRYDALNSFKTHYFHRYILAWTQETCFNQLCQVHGFLHASDNCTFKKYPVSDYEHSHRNPRVVCWYPKQAFHWKLCSTFGGYVLGLSTTIVVMNVFKAAQPALLYLVPAILAAAAIPAAYKGELREVRTA